MPEHDLTAALDRLRFTTAPIEKLRPLDAHTVAERAAAIEAEASALPPMARANFRQQHADTIGRAARDREQASASAESAARVSAMASLDEGDRKALTELASLDGALRAFHRRQHRTTIERAESAFAAALAASKKAGK